MQNDNIVIKEEKIYSSMLRNLNPEINVLSSKYIYSLKKEIKTIPEFKKESFNNYEKPIEE